MKQVRELFLDSQKAEVFLKKSLPIGRGFSGAREKRSNDNIILKSNAESIAELIDAENRVLQGAFIQLCNDEDMLNRWKEEYGIPNEMFPESPDNRKDVYCNMFLMTGNTPWHYKAIANLYGVVLRMNVNKEKWWVYDIAFDEGAEGFGFAYEFPFYFGSTEGIRKIRAVFKYITQAHVILNYVADSKGSLTTFKATEQEKKDMIKYYFRN